MPFPSMISLLVFSFVQISTTPTQTRTVTLQRRPFQDESFTQSTMTLMVAKIISLKAQ